MYRKANAMLSLSEAAELTGMTRQGLGKALRSGRLSGTRNENGEWLVDMAELQRVYEIVNPPTRPKPEETGLTTEATDHSRTDVLEREIELLRERIRDKDDVINDLRRRLDTSEDQRTQLNAVLVAQNEQNRVPFWKRLLG